MRITGIIVAAGSGNRMQSREPKQFIKINDVPMICYSIAAFENSMADEIIIVTAPDRIDYVKKEIVQEYGFGKVTKVVAGGAQRTDSVRSGIEAVSSAECRDDEHIIMIHDAARPMITSDMINKIAEETEENLAASYAVRVKDTIRKTDGGIVDRDNLMAMQTPQCFMLDIAREAFAKASANVYTDDVELVYQMLGIKSKLVEGSYKNIKVTTPEDLTVAEAYLK